MLCSRIASRSLASATAAARNSGKLITLSARAFAAQEAVDPMDVFDKIDTNSDGVLSRDEFKIAVEKMHYDDLLKIQESLSRNELSYNPSADKDLTLTETSASVIGRRMTVTAEVAISKIFPAGFGWQTAATLADGAGLQATDLSFFACTGLGDGMCVAIGHTIYMAGKKAITGSDDIDIEKEAQTGIMLGSAAVCSGFVWQPTVNALQSAGWAFETSCVATGAVAIFAFFTGLRLGRLVYSPIFRGVDEASYANLKADGALSVAIGGAAGCFLATDVSYEAANWMAPAIGIQESHSAVAASCLAGTSTFLGFSVVQTAENLVYAKDKCWVD